MAASRLILYIFMLTCVVNGWTYSTGTSNGKSNRTSHALLKSPIVFIPGDGGTQLEAKLTNKTSRVHLFCDKNSDWFDLWLNVHLLMPLVLDCFVDNMKLSYNFTDRKSYNSPGVEIRPFSFGSLDSVDYLDVLKLPKTQYFTTIIDKLVAINGYQRNVNMVGAGYDFRKAPNELDEFFQNLTRLIETTYTNNGKQKVTLICHSMGCLNTVYLLNRKTQSWKDTYIKRMISIAAPWGGSYKAITAMLFGDNLGVYLLSSYVLRGLQRTLPSLPYLLPVEPVFSKDKVLVQTSIKNYTLKNFDQFFVDSNFTELHGMWNDTKMILQNFTAPQVELWCLYSNGTETPSQVIFNGPIASEKYTIIQDDGDGTVNLESLSSCTRWRNDQKHPIYTHLFSGLDHIDVLRGDDVASFISNKIIDHEMEPAFEEELLSDTSIELLSESDGASLKPYRYSKRSPNEFI